MQVTDHGDLAGKRSDSKDAEVNGLNTLREEASPGNRLGWKDEEREVPG